MPQNTRTDLDTAELHQKSIYIIGGVTSLVTVALVVFAIAAFFIWPYKPGFTSTVSIFEMLQKDRLGGLMSMDLLMLVIVPFNIPLSLALYVALRRVNATYALGALILNLVAVGLLIQTRPLVELVLLSDKYAAATTEAARSHYLAAGEALLAVFSGTGWAVQNIFAILASLINCWLMLRTPAFSKFTAWFGIAINLIGLGFAIPVAGMVLLFLNTIGIVVWLPSLARDFFRLGRTPLPAWPGMARPGAPA